MVLQPSTGNVLAMVSNPTFDPNPLVSTSLQAEQLAYFSYTQKDHEGFHSCGRSPPADASSPGSTMKVVTSTAAYNLKPSLAGFNYPVQRCQTFADSEQPALRPDRSLRRDDDPDAAVLVRPGLRASSACSWASRSLTKQAELFGYNCGARDRPAQRHRLSASPTCRTTHRRFLGQTAIGQYYVQTTALQNAMVAAGIANGGVLMTPHLMSSIHDSQGALVQTYTPEAGVDGGDGPGGPAGHLPHGGRGHRAARRPASGSPPTCAPRSRPGTAQTDPTTGLDRRPG